jgi:hypothetical protein
MKYNYDNVSNDRILYLIMKWVHGERDRNIMKRRLIDHICFEPLAEEFGLSDRGIRKIVAKNEAIVYAHIDDPDDIAIMSREMPVLFRNCTVNIAK